MVDYKTMQLATCGGWNPLWLLVIGLCLSMEKPMFKARVAYHNMNYAYRWAYYAAWLKYRELTAAHVPFTPEAVIKAAAAAAIDDDPPHLDGESPPKLSNVFVHTGKRSLLFTVPLALTLVGELKSAAFFREHNTGGAALENHALIKTLGTYLSDKATLESCGIQPNQTLALVARLRGGANGPTLGAPGTMTAAVATAESALRAEMVARGDGADADDTIARIRAEPARFKDRQNALGELARKLIEKAEQDARMDVDPVVIDTPLPRPGRSSSTAVEVDVSRLSQHKFFRPLSTGTVCGSHGAPASHKFSQLHIDHHLSGFGCGSEEENAVRYLYQNLMYTSKPEPCKEIPGPGSAGLRGPFFKVREFDLAPPAEPKAHTEVLIFGSTQLSKTPEACTTCWAAFFVDGCLPVLCVRNKGGAISGSADMRDGIVGLNKRIEQIFRAGVQRGKIVLHYVESGCRGSLVPPPTPIPTPGPSCRAAQLASNTHPLPTLTHFQHPPSTRTQNLPESDYVKFKLHPRRTSNQEFVEFDENTRLLSRPQVLIMCMNPGQVKNLIGEAKGKQANAGALRGLIDIMKGETLHPYPPKCHNAYEPFDEGVNRPVARVYFVLDEVCPPASRPRLLTAP